jgi:uncharacterized protein
LIDFYRSLAPLAVSPHEYRQRCLAHVRGNCRELLAVKHHLPRGVVERVHAFQLQLLNLQQDLFEDRVRSGRIVEGHGDLRPEHICSCDPLAIFDCIEFNADFRCLDVADELAFLAAECDFLGADWVGPQLLHAYQQQSGDRPPEILFAFYKSYRACVRAKVAALRADQIAGPARETAAAEASRHLALADKSAAPWLRPLAVVIGGLSGSGKTTLASAVADALGAELLRTDVLRQKLFASPETDQTDDGRYSRQARQRVYDEMLRRTAQLLADGISVVLDGTFSSRDAVRKAHRLAADSQYRFLAVECFCREEVARARIGRRLAQGRDASEARPEIHDQQRRQWETWPADTPQVRIDTEQPLTAQVEQVFAALQ